MYYYVNNVHINIFTLSLVQKRVYLFIMLISQIHLILEAQLVYSLSDLFVGGTETTSTAIRWAILFLLHHPGVQNTIQQELDKVIGQSRLPSLDDRNSLPYVEAFLAEVLRLGNLTPLSLQHSNERDAVVNGMFIPAGSYLVPNLDSVLSDPDTFPNPDQFKPTRFIDENGKFAKCESFIPFGIGKFSH